jgi:hypothetical protein
MKPSCLKNTNKSENPRVSFLPIGKALVRGIFTKALLSEKEIER